MAWCLAGCAAPPDDAQLPERPSPDELEAGVAIGIRGPTGEAQVGAISRLGARTSKSDAGGVTLYLGVPPGRIPVQTEETADTPAVHAGVRVTPGVLTTTQLFGTGPVPTVFLENAASGGVVSAGDVTLDFPPGAILREGRPVAGRVDLWFLVVEDGDPWSMPDSHLALSADDELEGIDLFAAFLLDPPEQGLTIHADPELPELSLPVPPGLEAGAPEDLGLYYYSADDTHWVRAGNAEIVDGYAVAPVRYFAWWVLAAPRVASGCVEGTVLTTTGALLPGAELLIRQPGAFGAVRAHADEAGRFCAVVAPGLPGIARVFAIGKDFFQDRFSSEAQLPSAAEGDCDMICPTSVDVRPGGR